MPTAKELETLKIVPTILTANNRQEVNFLTRTPFKYAFTSGMPDPDPSGATYTHNMLAVKANTRFMEV